METLGSAILEPGTPLEAVRRLSSSYPIPTNAQAAAALDSFTQWVSADAAIAAGYPESARAFLAPYGVFPRMRLLAWGWTKPGDKFRQADDAAWWRRRYAHKLWPAIETYVAIAEQAGIGPPGVLWDKEMASGDPAELSRSLATVVELDLPPVNEAPCPRYLIPPTRGMLPIPNPSCIPMPDRPAAQPVVRSNAALWLLLAALVLKKRKDI